MCLTQGKRAAKCQDLHQNFASSGQSGSTECNKKEEDI